MNGVQRYILSGVLKAVAAVTLSTAAVVCLVRSLEFINYIVNHGLSVWVYLYLILLLMPSLLLLVLPIALFISVMFVYGKLAQDNELLAMRACGLSILGLARPAWMVALLIILVGYSMSLYFIPLSFKEFKDIEYFVRFRLANMVLREGQFNRLGGNITLYMRERTGEGVLTNVLIQDDRDPNKSITIITNRAILGQSGEVHRISMESGNIQEFDRKTQKVSTVYFDRYLLELDSKDLGMAGQRERGIAERNIHELLNPPTDTHRDRELYSKALAEGHQRLSSPILGFTYSAIGLAALFAGSFNRQRSSARLVFAGAAIAGIQVAHMLIVNAASLNSALLPAIHLLVAVPGLTALWLLYSMDQHAPRPSAWQGLLRRGTAVVTQG